MANKEPIYEFDPQSVLLKSAKKELIVKLQ